MAQTDGRGNVTARAYDALGRLAAVTDGAGAVTAYSYDEAGRLAAVTNALGNVVDYGYNARGQKVAEGGAVYPVQYGYDAFGQKVTMETFRDDAAETGDVTTWVYDEATGAVVAKTYADGRGVTYTLTDLGQVATRTDARGIVTTYTYNLYGDMTAIAYSDGTPGVSFTYDGYGRQASATDAANAYYNRWQIEDLFQDLKGAFAIEQTRFRTFRRLTNLIAIATLAFVYFAHHLPHCSEATAKLLKLMKDNQ